MRSRSIYLNSMSRMQKDRPVFGRRAANLKYYSGWLLCLLLLVSNALAQHLWWDLAGQGEGTCLYGEITVLATQPTTYYCGANWHPGEPAGGYCGIQHNGPQERRTIFSIWDTSPTLHPEVSEAGPQTVFGRFGGEGEGGHTHVQWDWKTNETFQFFVRKQGGGVNSFLENFSGQDPAAPRLALYRLWLGPDVDHLKCLTQAKGDGTWGELHDAYFLASGGTNELAAVFSALPARYGKPVFGEKGTRLKPISDRTLSDGLLKELQHLPRAAMVQKK
jgi:hypothetical protein